MPLSNVVAAPSGHIALHNEERDAIDVLENSARNVMVHGAVPVGAGASDASVSAAAGTNNAAFAAAIAAAAGNPVFVPVVGAGFPLSLTVTDSGPIHITGPGTLIGSASASVLNVKRPLGSPIGVTVTRLFQHGATNTQGAENLSKLAVTGGGYNAFSAGQAFHISSNNTYAAFGDDAGTLHPVMAGFLTVLGVGMDMPTVAAGGPVEYLRVQGATSGAQGLIQATIAGAGGAAAQVLFSSVTGDFTPGENLAAMAGGVGTPTAGTVIGTAGTMYLLKAGKPFRDSYATSAQIRLVDQTATLKLDVTIDGSGDPEAYATTRLDAIIISGQFSIDAKYRIKGGYSKAMVLKGCYRGRVEPNVVGSLPNHTTSNAYGYGISLDTCTEGVDVINPQGRNLRHLVTTNNNYTAVWAADGIVSGINKILEWGGPLDNTIHGGHGQDCTGAVYDTHPVARGTTFVGSVGKAVTGAGRAASTQPHIFSNRGIDTTYISCVADGGGFLDAAPGTIQDAYYVNRYKNCIATNFTQYGFSQPFDAVSDGGTSYWARVEITDCDFTGDGSTAPYSAQTGLYLGAGRTIVRRTSVARCNGAPLSIVASGSGSIMEIDLDIDYSQAPAVSPILVAGTVTDASIRLIERPVAGLTCLISNVSGSTNWKLEGLERRGSVALPPILLNAGGSSQITNINQINANSRVSITTTESVGTTMITPRTTAQIIKYNAVITADRVIQASTTTGAWVNGDWFKITRTAASTGAFNLIIKNIAGTTLKNLTPGTMCEIRHDGSDVYLADFSTL
jgi:hypothetical protein